MPRLAARILASLRQVIRWREGRVARLERRRPGAVELVVDTADGALPALAFPALVGEPAVGDRVLLNTNALALGLGTGGYAMVVAIPDRLPADSTAPGHIVKARYTPMQVTALAADEPESPYHELLRDADDLAGLPVVVADLHSALAPVLAAVRRDRPATRIGYVMTDGGALPAWLSTTLDELRAAGWLAAGVVTVGQAFGGDLEAVTLHSGLLAARLALGADLVVVTQGPGNLGTGTAWGFSGVATGEAVNAVTALHGRPVAGLRISQADPRPRHRGVSHHSLTSLGRVALSPADIAVPDLPGEFGDEVRRQAQQLSPPHRLVDIETTDLMEALRAVPGGLATMGRDLDADPAYFLACAAAGRLAARLLP